MYECRRDRLPAPAGGTPTCRCRLLEGEIDLLDRSPLLLVVVDLRTAAIFEGTSRARVPAHHGAAEPVVKLTVHLSPSTMSATGSAAPWWAGTRALELPSKIAAVLRSTTTRSSGLRSRRSISPSSRRHRHVGVPPAGAGRRSLRHSYITQSASTTTI